MRFDSSNLLDVMYGNLIGITKAVKPQEACINLMAEAAVKSTCTTGWSKVSQ